MASRILVVACGALAREVQALIAANRLDHIDVAFLSADLHMTPHKIPAAVEARLQAARETYDEVLVGYGDCGTVGALDAVLDRYGATRLPGAHCYEFLAGADVFAALHDAEPTTFYLTDFLLRQFDRLVWRGLGLDRWPHLRDAYFGNYTRVVYLSQAPPTAARMDQARRAADRLGLHLEHVHVGTGDMGFALLAVGRTPPAHHQSTRTIVDTAGGVPQ
jgi:hypothetical protein